MRFKDNNVWITGASKGIGEAMARAFYKEGANLILSARSMDKLTAIQASLTGNGSVEILSLDMVEHEQFAKTVDQVMGLCGGRIDILVNNAGISQRSLVAESSLEVDKKIFDVNFFGAVGLTKAVLPTMISNQKGKVVVISSLAGKLSTPYRSAYAASKHALHGWYDALRAEMHKNNIQVHMICPGYIKTDISINALNAKGEKHNKMDDNQAKGMSAEECAGIIVKAVASGKREILIGGREKYNVLLRKFLPGLYHNAIRKMASK